MGKQAESEIPGKRTIPDLDQPLANGFRKGVTKRDILKSMDNDDWKRVDEFKHYQQFNRNSITARICVQNDTVRADRDTRIDNVAEMINNIRNGITTNRRKQDQIDSGLITDELRPDVLMNKEELEFEIHSGARVIRNTTRRITLELGYLRNLVGTHDLLRNEIMDEKQYDKYVLDVEKQLKKLGVDLFDREVQYVGTEKGKV